MDDCCRRRSGRHSWPATRRDRGSRTSGIESCWSPSTHPARSTTKTNDAVSGWSRRLSSRIPRVVLALDMPVLALDEGMTRPKKNYDEGEKGGEYRQCDKGWRESKKASPAGWRNVNIMTGAPIVPRVRCLITKLEEMEFEVFTSDSRTPDKVLIECFPNETIWSDSGRSECPCRENFLMQSGVSP